MIDSKEQRINMVESQVRPSDVTDRRIIRAMLEIPREMFVPDGFRALAYMDEGVPVTTRADGKAPRMLLAPRTFAKLVQLAEIDADDVVLDVGCATGYSTAVLARLAKSVIAIEADAALAARAANALRQLQIENATALHGAFEAGRPNMPPSTPLSWKAPSRRCRRACSTSSRTADGSWASSPSAPSAAPRYGCGRADFDARPAFDAGAELLPGMARKAEFSF